MKMINGFKCAISGLLLTSLIALTGCASAPPKPVNTYNIVQLENLNKNNAPNTTSSSNQIRMRALKQAALTLGAQSGLSWRATEINATLAKHAKALRTIFNFDALILNHNVLPPVLVEAKQTVNLDDPLTIRTASQIYKIESNARFVTAPPIWRDYLYMDYPKPHIPDQTLLPTTRAEQAIWQRYVRIGWVSGVRQADTIYAVNLARLKQDFEGMVLYRKLLAEHMVTPPYVAITNLGVTGDKNHLAINDQVLRISALSALKTNSQSWTPIVNTQPGQPE